ncbi:MAG: hypothetical protein ACXVA9_09210, partial [Bdellovibrionales bacterium]
YWSGQGPVTDRHFWGLNGIFGFSKRFYNMTELDYEYQSARNSLNGLSQLAYEVYKGVTPYIQYQRSQSNLANTTTLTNDYGAGVHFYPRPHLELSGQWDHVYASSEWSDSAFLLGHYYF